jgi:8-oxo-dGTP pyrophosphatase MutT (NUDIX family)
MGDYIRYLRDLVGHNKVIMTVAGVFIFDSENKVLLQLRSDNQMWGHPGGFMELGETVEDTARREAFEETGLRLGKMELIGIYSGAEQERTLNNGDQIALVKIIFTCRDYEGILQSTNEESLSLEFFSMDSLPENLYREQNQEFFDLLSNKTRPIVR